MNTQTNLFHPNTSFIFCNDFLQIRVSLCISKKVAEELTKRGHSSNICHGKYRTVFFLTYSTKTYSKENIIGIQRFLLNQIMIKIRGAKESILFNEKTVLTQYSLILSNNIQK